MRQPRGFTLFAVPNGYWSPDERIVSRFNRDCDASPSSINANDQEWRTTASSIAFHDVCMGQNVIDLPWDDAVRPQLVFVLIIMGKPDNRNA